MASLAINYINLYITTKQMPLSTDLHHDFHHDLQSHLEQFLLDCARYDFIPPPLIKAYWAQEQLGYLQGIIDALGNADSRGTRSYQRNERTPATIRHHLEEYLDDRLHRWQVRELLEAAVHEAEAYFKEQGFDPSLAVTPRSARSHRSSHRQYHREGESGANYRLMSGSLGTSRRGRRKCYYTKIEELVGKANK